MILLWILAAALFAAFALIVLRGAPYVPTHTSQVRKALDLLELPKGATIIDLGSGDGVMLKEAAKRGYKAIGYELNPFLCVASYLRCWRYRNLVSVRWRDFWLTPLPKDTDAVFVFLAGPYLRQLNGKLEKEHEPKKTLKVASYGFYIPGRKPTKTDGALHLYEY